MLGPLGGMTASNTLVGVSVRYFKRYSYETRMLFARLACRRVFFLALSVQDSSTNEMMMEAPRFMPYYKRFSESGKQARYHGGLSTSIWWT